MGERCLWEWHYRMYVWVIAQSGGIVDGRRNLADLHLERVAVLVRKEARKVLVISGVERHELNLLEPQEDVGIP